MSKKYLRMAAGIGQVLLPIVLCLASAGEAKSAGLAWFDLGGSWQVVMDGSTEAIPATVPGCIYTDLLAAHKIPDPFYRDNEKTSQWIGETNWIYSRSFDVPADVLSRQHVLLRCEGLDTLAGIELNGHQIARTDNMFRTYEFDVKSLLQGGGNRIVIRFDSVLPVMRADEAKRKLPTWAFPGAAYVRKEPCNFGWDWGPTLISCGIWKKIGIVSFDTARLDDVSILQDHTSQPGKVILGVTVSAAPADNAKLKANLVVSLGTQTVVSTNIALSDGAGTTDLTINDPQLWWPAGMGAHPLYSVTVELLDDAGGLLDSATKRVGLRTMRVTQQEKDSPMHFIVNGHPFFAKGGNWIPCDSFATRVTPEKLRRYMEDAVACNMNCLRFWGGGYYEEDALYDLCDELGICIWLDFKFGCSTYPAFDSAFLDNVRLEARDNIKRLRHHPAIALWCGNNEIMYFRGPVWTADKMGEADYYRLFRDTIGDELHRLAPQADYVTGSPDCGDVHYWDVWHGGKPFEVYRDIHGFVSEFGFQSYSDPKTVDTYTTPEDRSSINSYVMKYHERSGRMYMQANEDGTVGTEKLMHLVRWYFREPKDFESTLWLSQINQGYGIKCGAEGWRREMPKSMGCVFWQYDDTWPGTSWASVDYFGRWKALQFMAKRFYAPVLVSGLEDDKLGKVDVYVTSDRLKDCKGKLTWTLTTVAGDKIQQGTENLVIPAAKSQMVRSLQLQNELAKWGTNNVLVWLSLRIDGKTVSDNLVTLAYPKALELGDPQFSTSVAKRNGAFTVKIKAQHPALWTWLQLEGDPDARFSDNFVHVRNGEAAEIVVTPAKDMTAEEFQKALRVRSLYDTYQH